MARKQRNFSNASLDYSYAINPTQFGGIELLQSLDGPSSGNRVAWVNTGSGLHYKIAIDRGLDIAEAFYKGISLSWLSLSGITRPEISLNRGIDWLWGFFGGLLVSCGPSSAGAPCEDSGQELPLHGRHSNLSATIESIINADPINSKKSMSITGIVREARLFNPNIELRRTISSPMNEAKIEIEDIFTNRGNVKAEHAWLLHMNLGYPLIEPGTEFVFKGELIPREDSVEYFKKRNFKILPKPIEEHRGTGEAVAYIEPATDKNGLVHCGVINSKRGIGLKISFAKKDFPRFVNWQHFGPNGQYVMGIEPANCGVEGRDVDRKRGWLKFLKPGQMKKYRVTIEVLEGDRKLDEFRKICQ